jgi:leucyl aminopeptidase
MKVRLVQQDITEAAIDAIIVNLFEGVTAPGGATGAVDKATGGAISKLIADGEFTGKLNETITIYPRGIAAKKVVVVGLGEAHKFDMERVRQVAGAALKAASRGKVGAIATIVHGAGIGGLDPIDCAEAVVEGSLLAAYHYSGLKSKPEEQKVAELVIVERTSENLNRFAAGIRKGEIMANATNLVRDLVNAPGNYMTPTNMAETATGIAREGNLKLEVLEKADMERLGMGCLLGVAQGSVEPPKMIMLKYEGNPGGETAAIVGKGLTFDSGGISIKPTEGMEAMKDDMGGGAAVLGAMLAIGQLKPKTNVIGVVPCTENMPSGSAVKPGDVLRGMSGKTIEVISTDAEGRLILADAVAYAESLGATRIVDVATLTGACVVALGNVYAGLVANCDKLVELVQAAAKRAGEKYWRFPSDDEYKDAYKSPVADMRNKGGRAAGTIIGGLIIAEFLQKAAWAHLDIAAMVTTESEKGYQVKGATGFATRTLVELALGLAK